MGGSHARKVLPTAKTTKPRPAPATSKPTSPKAHATQPSKATVARTARAPTQPPPRVKARKVFQCRNVDVRRRRATTGLRADVGDAGDVGWGTLDITFGVGAAPPGISPAVFHQAVLAALQTWRQAVPFRFAESGASVLSVAGVPPSHGDAFDFPPGTAELAHGFGPVTGGGSLDGQVHLNNGKTWADGGGADGDVFTVVLHELGHALGISTHSADAANVMNGTFPAGLVRRTLTQEDIDAMRALYAALLT
jgi:Matrixin